MGASLRATRPGRSVGIGSRPGGRRMGRLLSFVMSVLPRFPSATSADGTGPLNAETAEGAETTGNGMAGSGRPGLVGRLRQSGRRGRATVRVLKIHLDHRVEFPRQLIDEGVFPPGLIPGPGPAPAATRARPGRQPALDGPGARELTWNQKGMNVF
jgi:hypothetical protein